MTPEVAEVGGVLLGEARRLERLVGDLLDLARLEALDFRIDSRSSTWWRWARCGQVWARRCQGEGVRFAYEAPGVTCAFGPTAPGCGRCWTDCWRTR